MTYQAKDNTGSLFANDKREKDSHPHAKGTALINGVEYWVSAWTNTSAGGKRYQSLKFEAKEQQAGGFRAPAQDLNDDPFDDPSVPF